MKNITFDKALKVCGLTREDCDAPGTEFPMGNSSYAIFSEDDCVGDAIDGIDNMLKDIGFEFERVKTDADGVYDIRIVKK